LLYYLIFLFLGAHVRAVSLPLGPASTLSLYLLVVFGLLFDFHLFCLLSFVLVNKFDLI